MQLFTQVVVIFLLMLMGALIHKLGFLHAQSVNDLTNITLSPLVIIKAFEQPFSLKRMVTLAILVLLVFLTYFVSIVIAQLAFAHESNLNLKRIAIYGSIYSNNGFMGVPLAMALFESGHFKDVMNCPFCVQHTHG